MGTLTMLLSDCAKDCMNPLHSLNTEKEQVSFATNTLTDVLDKLANFREDSCLQIVYNSTTFFLHFNEGKLIYATNSLAPFERLERHLRRLSNLNSKLDNEVIKQPRSQFLNDLHSYTQLPSDYQGLLWLKEQNHLDEQQTITLIRRMTREVFESLLCITNSCQYKLIPRVSKIPELCQFNLDSYLTQCQKRIEAWQAFDEKIWSSYQRPYLVTEKTQSIGNLSAEQNQTICKLLKGLNFRQISAILDLDELVVAKILYPSMLDNTIVVRDPKAPFDQLPPLPRQDHLQLDSAQSDWRGEDSSGFQVNSHSKQTVMGLENTWKVAYVDHDSSVHPDFIQYLDQKLFSLLTIGDPLNAFAEIIEFEPDLVVLEINMPDLNGYELCSLLRNHHTLKTIPIILLHEAYEPINPGKFKRSGATESITKPLNKSKLLNIVFKYLQ